jgi:hypothetical protein
VSDNIRVTKEQSIAKNTDAETPGRGERRTPRRQQPNEERAWGRRKTKDKRRKM